MNQQTADELIEKAVKMAIKEYAKEERAVKKNKALHNTKMLLKNYEKIKSSIDEAISEVDQLEQNSIAYDDEEDIYISSIRRSKLKSLIVIAHIDKALAIIQAECKRKGIPEKYNAFISCMLNGMTYEEAAEEYDTSQQSISRWLNDISKSISIQLFGVEGVDFI